MAIRSGDRVATGTGANRRRLTLEEAEAGGLPEPMTREEWAAMYYASRHLHNSTLYPRTPDHPHYSRHDQANTPL